MKDGNKEPKRIIVQILNDDSEVVRFLKSGEGDFELPEYLDFPMGKMDVSKRGKRLMLAGLSYLKEKYPRKVGTNSSVPSQDPGKPKGWG